MVYLVVVEPFRSHFYDLLGGSVTQSASVGWCPPLQRQCAPEYSVLCELCFYCLGRKRRECRDFPLMPLSSSFPGLKGGFPANAIIISTHASAHLRDPAHSSGTQLLILYQLLSPFCDRSKLSRKDVFGLPVQRNIVHPLGIE